MIKNIIFDVGMVLVDFCWQRVFEQLGFTGETYDAVADATARSGMWTEFDRSRMGDEEILAGFIANAPEQEKNIRLFWEHVGDTISCYPYSVEWVQTFKDKGYKCYILSNYPKRTYELTRQKLPFEKLMDGALYSYQVQQIKPEPEIYQTLLKKYSLKPEECVFLDDSPKNVEGAKRAGIHAIQFTTKKAVMRELERLGVK